MPELKRNFAKAKMNKDIDERILPLGEYRDALNIQVSTSSSGDVGSVQNIKGNTKINSVVSSGPYTLGETDTCVGVTKDPATDKVYYFMSSIDTASANKDYIIEYDTTTDKLTYVFVDIYRVATSLAAVPATPKTFLVSAGGTVSDNRTGIRVGMDVTSVAGSLSQGDDVVVESIEYDATLLKWKVTTNKNHELANTNDVVFIARRVLELPSSGLITGLNVLDETIFWTDNETEPKKINIKRSIKGTGGTEMLPTSTLSGDNDYHHTRFVRFIESSGEHSIVTNLLGTYPTYVKHEDVTVARKSPTQALSITMFNTEDSRDGKTVGIILNTQIYNGSHPVGSIIEGLVFVSPVEFYDGEIVVFSALGGPSSTSGVYDIRTKVIVTSGGAMNFEVLSISGDLINTYNTWDVRLENADPFLESKFVRFSYRFKYQSGEYSTFAPWSRVAFLPSTYNYFAQEGYNKGMSNTIRNLRLENYLPKDMPAGVSEVDLLYKETNNPTVYTVKTLKRSDENASWPLNPTGNERFELATDLVHAVVPSNQLIRPWDNIPRKALAQEVSANRVIYGNYLQNYNVDSTPKINVSLSSSLIETSSIGIPSVKSLREYQVGVVFNDEYGRETPVLTSENANIKVPILNSSKANKLVARLDYASYIPDWATHYSFYIKEPTVEYYTLAMDRWYNAADGNIWLSFPSSERNKITDETFLYLKKAHGNNSQTIGTVRYKVLAIENEAPDYIKTLYNLLTSTVDIGTSAGGGVLVGGQQISVPYSVFENMPNVDLETDSFRLKFIDTSDTSNVSRFYDVDKVTSSNNSYFFHLHGFLGSDIGWASTNNSFETQIDTLALKIYQGEPKSRPEYDGRFFVKILKDLDVVNTVTSHEGFNWIIKDSQEIAYINNNCYVNSDPNVTEAVLRTNFDSGVSANHPTEHTSHTPAYTWATSETGMPGQFDITTNSVEAINGVDSADFWELAHGKFFIDRCSAYSWNGRTSNLPGSAYGENDTGSDGYWANAGGGVAIDNNIFSGVPPELLFNLTYFEFGSNLADLNSLPSRGIWNEFNTAGGGFGYMDLSWSGFNEEPAEWAQAYENFSSSEGGLLTNPQSQVIRLSEDSTRATETNFIESLYRPFSRFRFVNDPDSTIYKTEILMNLYNGTDDGFYTNAPSNTYTGGQWQDYDNSSYRFGGYGIRNYMTSEDPGQYHKYNLRNRWTLKVSPPFGSGPSGYIPTTGTRNDSPGIQQQRALHHDGSNTDVIQVLTPSEVDDDGNDISGGFVSNPAIWETEPRESVDIDIYYQASDKIPLRITKHSGEDLAPSGSTFTYNSTNHTITGWDNDKATINPALSAAIPEGGGVTVTTPNGRVTSFNATGSSTQTFIKAVTIGQGILFSLHKLNWSNCFAFGNGVESDRVRDDYNAPQLDNGVKASTVLAGQVKEERRGNGLIWSGIYNSTSGVNHTNQFIAAEKITKDTNPSHGSIQRLLARDNHLVILCEDKVLRAVTNKDALYNADGNPQLVASNAVIGDTVTYQGNWGISKNPESLAVSANASYFTDSARGSVLSLTSDGITPISSIGMENYFTGLKSLSGSNGSIIGGFDERKREYNITTTGSVPKTVSFSERSKSWVSFKSFIPQASVSLNNNYYTLKDGYLWKHHSNTVRNLFYDDQYNSSITTIFSDTAGGVKSFNTFNYEGSKARVTAFVSSDADLLTGDYSINSGLDTDETTFDGEYFNLTSKTGWYMESIKTDMQEAWETEFKEKEGKWFGRPAGKPKDSNSAIPSSAEFSTQGLGVASVNYSGTATGVVSVTARNSSGAPWD